MKKQFKDADYPVLEIVCDDTERTGIRLLSIVDEPAIEMMGVAFNKEGATKDYQFKAQEDKQIIVGPGMIPNKKILRKDEDGNFYYNVFKSETILKLVQKFNSQGTNRKINVDHSNKMVDAYIMENWIVEDTYYDKSRMYGFNVPVGTWMVSIKIEDKDFWKKEVKELGKFGFSIEGVMGERPMEYSVSKFLIEKKPNETKNEFVSRCISSEIKNGHEQNQAVAMCISMWENYEKVEMESIIDNLDDAEVADMLKVFKYEEGEVCCGCGWSWNLEDGGSDPYICHKCGKDNKPKEFKKWRSSPDSSNVDKIMYNDETSEMVIRFNDGSTYTYFNVDFDMFRDVFEGNASCVSDDTSGEGRWWVGKTPSVGAAVYKILTVGGVPYTEGGSLK